MSIQDVVKRAIDDENFRNQLMKDPAAALEGFELSDKEREIFKNAKGKDFSDLLTDLGPRASFFTFPPTP